MNTQKLNITKGRVFIVGDIHGMFTLLDKTLKVIDFNEEIDTLISVGDLVDRGDESEKFIEFLKRRYVYAVKGNHEIFMINGVINPRFGNIVDWRKNGGNWSFDFTVTEEMLKDVINLPIALEISFKNKKIGIVHTGVPIEINDWNELLEKLDNESKITEYNCLWDRSRAKRAIVGKSERISNIDLVIGGHTIQRQIYIDKNSLFIDTGAFFLSSNYPEQEFREDYGLTIVELLVDEDNELVLDPYQYDSVLYLKEMNDKLQ
jgi:serine/threonine protein phosphatase 1